MADAKPNILFVMADQLAAQFLPFHGHPLVKTPNLSRLAAEGVVFENCYSTSPLCAPARATVMNGLLPSRTGVYDNAAEFPSSIPTWAHYLRLAGYKTCLSGKMHFVGPDQLHGLEERLTTDIYPADFGWTPDWRLRQERIDWWYHNMTRVLQPGIAEITNQLEFDDEVAFLAIRKIYDYVRFEPDKPFCLMASFTHPHDPYAARKKFWDLYRDEDIDLPAVPRMDRADLDPHSQRLYDVSAMDDYTVTRGRPPRRPAWLLRQHLLCRRPGGPDDRRAGGHGQARRYGHRLHLRPWRFPGRARPLVQDVLSRALGPCAVADLVPEALHRAAREGARDAGRHPAHADRHRQ